MRTVTYYEYERESGKSTYEKVPKGKAIFHQFGVSYEEFDDGPGNYSTAIIELPDGTVKNVSADMIVFEEPIGG